MTHNISFLWEKYTNKCLVVIVIFSSSRLDLRLFQEFHSLFKRTVCSYFKGRNDPDGYNNVSFSCDFRGKRSFSFLDSPSDPDSSSLFFLFLSLSLFLISFLDSVPVVVDVLLSLLPLKLPFLPFLYLGCYIKCFFPFPSMNPTASWCLHCPSGPPLLSFFLSLSVTSMPSSLKER